MTIVLAFLIGLIGFFFVAIIAGFAASVWIDVRDESRRRRGRR